MISSRITFFLANLSLQLHRRLQDGSEAYATKVCSFPERKWGDDEAIMVPQERPIFINETKVIIANVGEKSLMLPVQYNKYTTLHYTTVTLSILTRTVHTVQCCVYCMCVVDSFPTWARVRWRGCHGVNGLRLICYQHHHHDFIGRLHLHTEVLNASVSVLSTFVEAACLVYC